MTDQNESPFTPRFTSGDQSPEPPQHVGPGLTRRVRLPILLFVATCLSTWITGGLAFSMALMTILLAHEFGHYRGGDLKAGPWIHRTRSAIGRTIDSLTEDEVADQTWSQSAIRKPFIWYGNAFLRITAAISRRQEFAADACAVQSVGRAAHVSGLQRLHAFGSAFDFYWHNEIVPVLESIG